MNNEKGQLRGPNGGLSGTWRETPALGGTSFIALVRWGLPLGKESQLASP